MCVGACVSKLDETPCISSCHSKHYEITLGFKIRLSMGLIALTRGSTYAKVGLAHPFWYDKVKKRLHSLTWQFEAEGPKEIIMDKKCTWISTWHDINNVSWSVGICVKPNTDYDINMSIIRPLDETQGSPQLSYMVMARIFVAIVCEWPLSVNPTFISLTWTQRCCHLTSFLLLDDFPENIVIVSYNIYTLVLNKYPLAPFSLSQVWFEPWTWSSSIQSVDLELES